MQTIKYLKVKTHSTQFQNSIFITNEMGFKKALNTVGKSWSDAAKKQWSQKTQNFKIAETAPYSAVTINFESGAAVHVLALPEKISTFELQTTLTKCFGSVVKSNTGDIVVVDASHLKKDLEKLTLESLVSLSVLETWDYPKQTKKKSEKKDNKVTEFHFLTTLTPKELEELVTVQTHLANATNLVRTLAETPANLLKPNHYVDIIKSRAKEHGYGFKFHDVKTLEKMGAGCFVAVAKGDPDHLGGIVQLSYRPKGKTPKSKVALVGKGICFDTGGYNIKTGNYMYTMHRDMTGSAVALALFETLVQLEVSYEVQCYLALAENLISPHANRPNDLVYALNNMSVEIIDTDAEGRLVLADTLVMASREKPDVILDWATLTGTAVRALDTTRAAVFSNDSHLLKKSVDAGESCGERAWGFPMGEDYKWKLKSDVADIKQLNEKPNADHIYAATFLNEFVHEGVKWVHMDLTTESNGGGLGLVKTEVTGFGVRWGFEMLKGFK